MDQSPKGDFVKVGKVKDAHGIRGELFIVIFAGEAAWVDEIKQLRLVVEDQSQGPASRPVTKSPKASQPQAAALEPLLTLTVKSLRIHKNGLIAKTEELRDRNAAEALKGRVLEIPSNLFVSKPGETMYLREVQGFKVSTVQKGEIGKVTGFSSNTAQDLLVVQTSWGEFEIPFVEAFVQKIDFDKSELLLDLPEGLLGESPDGNGNGNGNGNGDGDEEE